MRGTTLQRGPQTMTAPVGEHECAQACGAGIPHGPGWLSGNACTYSTDVRAASHEGCWVRTQLHAIAAPRGGQDRRCSRRQARLNEGRERCKRIGFGSAWRLGS